MPGAELPAGHNAAVMRVRSQFAEEVKHRQAEREHTLALTQGQKYVLRELRAYFAAVEDEDVKGQINILERAFRGPVTTAVNKDLNTLRRNGVHGPIAPENARESLPPAQHPRLGGPQALPTGGAAGAAGGLQRGAGVTAARY